MQTVAEILGKLAGKPFDATTRYETEILNS